jgi:hypothetical protein
MEGGGSGYEPAPEKYQQQSRECRDGLPERSKVVHLPLLHYALEHESQVTPLVFSALEVTDASLYRAVF